MRTAAKVSMAIMVLALSREADAGLDLAVRDYTIKIAGHDFGFCDWPAGEATPFDTLYGESTTMYLGPLGEHRVPFTAIQGVSGVFLILTALIVLAVLLAVRRKRMQPRQ